MVVHCVGFQNWSIVKNAGSIQTLIYNDCFEANKHSPPYNKKQRRAFRDLAGGSTLVCRHCSVGSAGSTQQSCKASLADSSEASPNPLALAYADTHCPRTSAAFQSPALLVHALMVKLQATMVWLPTEWLRLFSLWLKAFSSADTGNLFTASL